MNKVFLEECLYIEINAVNQSLYPCINISNLHGYHSSRCTISFLVAFLVFLLVVSWSQSKARLVLIALKDSIQMQRIYLKVWWALYPGVPVISNQFSGQRSDQKISSHWGSDQSFMTTNYIVIRQINGRYMLIPV